MNPLLQPMQLGDCPLPNRIVMAPLTRCRASAGRIPNTLMAEYYGQRASAGLILSEATVVSPQGVGYPSTPGIWSEEQVKGWRLITDTVHDRGGRIFLQLWHVGRISDPSYLEGDLPVAPSAVTPAGHVNLLRPIQPFVTPRALELSEIPGVVAAFRQGAIHAQQAGFDGVEIHGANGYLLDQFLQDSTNHRTDDYGGAIENRARLLLEVTDAITSIWGAGRVGVHLSPRGDTNDMGDSDPMNTFGYVAEQLGQRKIAFIFTRESLGPGRITPELKRRFGGMVIANEGFSVETAIAEIESGHSDAVAFGKSYISTPNLVSRVTQGLPFAPFDAKTFYGHELPNPRVGYVDYPTD